MALDAQIQAAVDDVKKTLTDMRAANDEALAGKVSKEDVDVILSEKVDRINNAVTDAADKLKALEDEKVAATARVDDLEKRLNRPAAGGNPETQAKQAAEFFSLVNGARQEPPVLPADADVQAFGDYKAAFNKYLRRGDQALRADVRNALSVGSDPDGGYWVEPEQSSRIITRVFETSEMRSHASVITIGTDAVEYPTDTNDFTSGGWVGEKQSRTETATPEVGMHRIPVHEQYAEPRATQKLLDDAQFPVEQWLADKGIDKFVRTENTAFVSGAGVASPKGFLTYKDAAVVTDDASRAWGVLQYVASGAAGAFPTISAMAQASNPDAVLTLISKLKPMFRSNAIFAMNRATEAAVRKLKDADGRYFVGMGNLESNAHGFDLFGYPIATFEDMPDIAADSFSIAFGDFGAGYQIVDRQGLRILRDPFTAKPYVKFYMTKRTGGDVLDYDAIKLMKFAA